MRPMFLLFLLLSLLLAAGCGGEPAGPSIVYSMAGHWIVTTTTTGTLRNGATSPLVCADTVSFTLKALEDSYGSVTGELTGVVSCGSPEYRDSWSFVGVTREGNSLRIANGICSFAGRMSSETRMKGTVSCNLETYDRLAYLTLEGTWDATRN